MFAARFASIANAVAARYGGPFHAGVLHWPGEPVFDDGGSIVTPGVPVDIPCQVQIDSVTEAMRAEAGFTDRDVRLIALAPGLTRPVDSAATVQVLPGATVPADHVGLWSIQSVSRDPLGCYLECRGRRQ